MLCSRREIWEHTTELSLLYLLGSGGVRDCCLHPPGFFKNITGKPFHMGVHSPCAECDSAVTHVNVLKVHNESKLVEIRCCAVQACFPGAGGCGSLLPPTSLARPSVGRP